MNVCDVEVGMQGRRGFMKTACTLAACSCPAATLMAQEQDTEPNEETPVDVGKLQWKLAAAEPIIIRDQRLQLDWLSHGKVSILIAPKTDVYFEFKRNGAPVQAVTPAEGVWLSAGSCGISLFNRPAHPNAAKLFINWLLSKDGQTAYSKTYGGQSAREDVPTDHLHPLVVRDPAKEYFSKETEDYLLLKSPELLKKSTEAFKDVLK